MFRARFFVHFISQSCTIVHEKCTIFFVLNKKIVPNRANAKPYYFALEFTYNSCRCFLWAFYKYKSLVGVKSDRFWDPEIIFLGVENSDFQKNQQNCTCSRENSMKSLKSCTNNRARLRFNRDFVHENRTINRARNFVHEFFVISNP